MPVKVMKETPSQTAGPYVHIGMVPAAAGLPMGSQERLDVLAGADVEGERIRIRGVIQDGADDIVRDAVVEVWQADSRGRFGASAFSGWGRAACDFKTGEWCLETVKPGPTPAADGRMQAPHVNLLIFARGINIHLHTRLYFPDEEAANADDPVLAAVGSPALRQTLIATAEGAGLYRFAIHLQGERETVFFDV